MILDYTVIENECTAKPDAHEPTGRLLAFFKRRGASTRSITAALRHPRFLSRYCAFFNQRSLLFLGRAQANNAFLNGSRYCS